VQIIRTRPFPFGNQKIGYECMREMLVRSPYRWVRQMENADDVIDTLKRVETRDMTLAEFIAWVRERVVKA
jgi:prophage maintenance system killer protein